MASTYVNDLRLEEMATGDQSGTWGDTTNVNLELIAEAFSYGTEASFSSDADATTTIADGASDPARSLYLKVTSGASLTATRTLTIAPNTVSKVWIIENATSGSQSINISQGSGANVTIPNGDVKVIYTDGAGAGAAVVDAFTNLTSSGTITATNLAGTLTTAAQPNITSVGTLTGLTTTGNINLGDSDKVIFGAGSDLQIYHDGSNSYIDEVGTGRLYIRAADNITLTNADGSETFANFANNGAVGLRYDNSTKIVTTSTGIDVTGTVVADGLDVDGTATITYTGTGDCLVLESTEAGASAAPDLVLYRNSSSPADGDDIGNILFKGKDDGGNDTSYAFILGEINDASDGSEDGNLFFRTQSAGSLDNRLSIVSNKIGINTDSPDTIMEIVAADPVLTVRDTETGVADANATLRLAESGGSDTLGSHFDVGLGNNQILSFGFSADGTAATEQMKLVGSTGNLVLTTNPSSLYFGDTSSGSFVKGTNTGGYLILGTSNTERARLTTTGLGIGTTTADLLSIAFDGNISSDYTAFDVDIGKAGGSAITNLKGINVDLSSADITGGDEITNLYGAYINNSTAGGAAGVITNWYGIYIPAADADRTDNPVSAYFGDSVGIGVASPTGALDVNGDIKLDGNYPVGTRNVALGNTALDDGSFSGVDCTAVGANVLTANTSGGNNSGFGSNTLLVNTTGAGNTALGATALKANTTASSNTGLGYGALLVNTTGAENTAVGKSSMVANTTGSYNVAVGVNALDANTTANNNTALGFKALTNTTTAGANTAIGSEAAHDNTTGSRLTAVGYKALYANTTGINNTAVGCEYSGLTGPLGANTTGSSNVAMGDGALGANTTASFNTAVGLLALRSNTTGSGNVALGYTALDANTTASANTAIGDQALTDNTTGTNLVAVGQGSLEDNTTASNNTAVGRYALRKNTTGASNTAVGANALDANTTASNNTAVGYLAASTMTTGNNNTAVGVVALQNYNVTDCVAVGAEALRDCQGNRNIGIGNEAARFATGDDNIVIGDLAADTGTFTGSDNIMIGSNAGTRATSSEANVFIGFQSGEQVTTGDDNTFVGYDSGDTVTTGFQNTCIGSNSDSSATIANATALGYGITVTASNNVFIGNTSVAAIKGQVAFSTYSDERIKREIEDSDLGLEFIKDLKPRKYKRVAPKDYPEEFLDKNKNDLSNPDEVVDGLIAQEVKQTMDKLGVSFSGWDEDENTTKQSLEYATFVPALIKSIQELSSQVDELKAEIQTLKGE